MNLRYAKVIIVVLISSFSSNSVQSQLSLDYYLPEINYDAEFSTPESVLGYQIGEQHITHDQLVYYLEKLCSESNNCVFKEYARSHGKRPLVYLTISSEENLSEIESLREKHNKLVYTPDDDSINLDETPLVLYQGYSIHGDEASGANAVPLVAYYLLAGQSQHLNELLDKTIIILDPCYNPDGTQRFSTWANMHRSYTDVTDPRDREFNEVWPRGRTNHYWFDLNRDWIFNVHPESKGRTKVFHEWKPDILTDHHEMGSNNTFFFQPGIPSRTNPMTPQINQDLTEQIGHYHAANLDSIGSLYFSKESYDDYYYGKGSTYPDIHGCIGILFEQASSRGYLRETTNGLLSFPFTIRNQVVTSFSTQKAALEMRNEILSYKRDFYKNNPHEEDGYFIFEAPSPYVKEFFVDLLNRHDINVYQHNHDKLGAFKDYSSKDSYLVPKDQTQAGLVKTIFERVDQFPDSLFYDVSAWTLPLAFNLKYDESNSKLKIENFTKVEALDYPFMELDVNNSYAIGIDWSEYMAPNILHKLLSNQLSVRVLPHETTYKSKGQDITLSAGSVIVPLKQAKRSKNEVLQVVMNSSPATGMKIYTLDSGQSTNKQAIGSSQNDVIKKPEVALVVGEGINRYDAGCTWHLLDTRFEIPVTLLDHRQMKFADLNRYNVIILSDGSYNENTFATDKFKQWVRDGGVVISVRRSINFLNKLNLIKVEIKPFELEIPTSNSYSNTSNVRGAQVIGGAIYETTINLEHPLFYGYSNSTLPVFKRGTQFYLPSEIPFASPMKYSNNPLMSGYSSKRNVENAKGAAAATCFGYGRGRIIAFVDNPNFRGYWLGGSKLFANAIFYNSLIDSNSLAR